MFFLFTPTVAATVLGVFTGSTLDSSGVFLFPLPTTRVLFFATVSTLTSTSRTVGCPPFSAAGVEATSCVFTGLLARLSFTAVVALTFFPLHPFLATVCFGGSALLPPLLAGALRGDVRVAGPLIL